jgi:hypothetical protein
VPHPIGPGEVEWLESNFRRYYELTGVSQMNATARKEPGITAGVAIRTMNDMQSARFSVKAKSYENAFPLLGRRIVACAREVAADNDYKLPWPGQAFHREISWKRDAELQEDMYSVQLSPASAMPNDPAGKLQTAQELFQAGVINPPAFKRLIDMPDLEDELKAESAERDYLEDLVDRYLDADKDDEDFEFEGPQGYILDKPGALALVAQHYFQSKRQRAPEFNQSLLRTYMKLLDKQISAATAPPQVMAGGLGPTPMTPAPGGPLPPAAAPPLPAAA